MDNTIIMGISAVLLVFCTVALAYLVKQISNLKTEISFLKTKGPDNSALQLQAYERLALFAERSSLKNLVSRTEAGEGTAWAKQMAMLQEIKNEYDFNTSQQIYVTPEVWHAVGQLKDQNSYIINQIAMMMKSGATDKEFSEKILEYSMNENAELTPVVQNAIQFEAKKLM